MLLDNGEEFFYRNVLQVLIEHAYGVVHRYGADHGRRHADKLAAEFPCLAKVRQVHNGFCLHVDSILDLLQFFFVVIVFR